MFAGFLVITLPKTKSLVFSGFLVASTQQWICGLGKLTSIEAICLTRSINLMRGRSDMITKYYVFMLSVVTPVEGRRDHRIHIDDGEWYTVLSHVVIHLMERKS